jgi:predicted nucleic acid-binding protein
LPGHAAIESYSVLTRLPGGLAVPPATAARVLAERFRDAPLLLPPEQHDALVATLAAAGVFGGASYDGLVALEARAHDHTVLTLDQRAQSTYERLRVPFRVIDGAL